MKPTLLGLALALLLGTLAAPAPAVDDPWPEPASCLLCGGDPQLHVDRTFAIVTAGGAAAVRVLSW